MDTALINCKPLSVGRRCNLPIRGSRARISILAVFIALMFSIIIALFTPPSSSIKDLSGKVGAEDNKEIISTMNPFAQIVYNIGDWNCHQISSRSLYLNGNEMPVCARDTGIILGAVVGTLMAIVIDPKFRWLFLILGLAPMAVDGLLQLVTSYESTNEIRLLTGILAGVARALLLSHLAWKSLSLAKQEVMGKE